MVKYLANKFQEKFECLGETQKSTKHVLFKCKKKSQKKIKIVMEVLINFTDSARFVASSLSSLADNLAEEIPKIKCKDCNCFLEYERTNENSVKDRCFSCNKDNSKENG